MDVTLWMVGIIVLAWIVAPHPEYLEKAHQRKDTLGLPYLLGSSIELILYNTISWILLGTLFERVVIGRPYPRRGLARNVATRQLKRRICSAIADIRFDLRKKLLESKNRRESILSRIEAIAALLGTIHRETIDICAMPVVIALTLAGGFFSLAASSFRGVNLVCQDVLIDFQFESMCRKMSVVSFPTSCMYLVRRYVDVSPLPGDEQVFLCLTVLTICCSVCSVVSQFKANSRVHQNDAPESPASQEERVAQRVAAVTSPWPHLRVHE